VDHSTRKTHWKHPAEQGLQPATPAGQAEDMTTEAETVAQLAVPSASTQPSVIQAGAELVWQEEQSPSGSPSLATLNDTQAAFEASQLSTAALASLGKSVGETLDELLANDPPADGAPKAYNMPDWPGWEEKSTPEGKSFYVDHSTRKTHWKHPSEQKKTPKKSMWKSLIKTGLTTATAVIRDKLDENEALVTSVLDNVGQGLERHVSSTEQSEALLSSVLDDDAEPSGEGRVAAAAGSSIWGDALSVASVAMDATRDIRSAAKEKVKAAAKDAIKGTALGDLHRLLTEKPPMEEEKDSEPREPIGTLRVEILGTSGLTLLDKDEPAKAPFAQLQVEYATEKSEPQPQTNDPTQALKQRFEFKLTDVTTDLLVTIMEFQRSDPLVVGAVCVPLSALMPNFGLSITQEAWFELMPPPNHNANRKYASTVPNEAYTGLQRPTHLLGTIHLRTELQLNQRPLSCYLSAQAPIALPPDSLRFDVALIKRHAARLEAVFVRPPRWLIAAQLGGGKGSLVAVGLLGLMAYICFSAPFWQYPVLIVLVVAVLSLLGASVPASRMQLWEDEIDDPDVGLSLAQKTKKAVVFLSKLQYLLGMVASALERVRALFSWKDQFVTGIALVVSSMSAILLSVLLLILQQLPVNGWIQLLPGTVLFGLCTALVSHQLWLPGATEFGSKQKTGPSQITQQMLSMYQRIPDANEAAHRQISATQRQ